MERQLRSAFGGREWVSTSGARVLLGLVTFVLVAVTWVFFRSPTFAMAGTILGSMAGLTADGVPVVATIDIIKTLVVIVPMLALHWFLRDSMVEEIVSRVPWWLGGLAWAAMLIIIIITQGGGGAFIYFQF